MRRIKEWVTTLLATRGQILSPGCRACTGSTRPPEDCDVCDWGR